MPLHASLSMLLAVRGTLSVPLPLPDGVGSALSPFVPLPSVLPWGEHTACFNVWFVGEQTWMMERVQAVLPSLWTFVILQLVRLTCAVAAL